MCMNIYMYVCSVLYGYVFVDVYNVLWKHVFQSSKYKFM